MFSSETNIIGKQCVCCEKYYPIESTGSQGNTIYYPDNAIDMCPECFNTLLSIVRKEIKGGAE